MSKHVEEIQGPEDWFAQKWRDAEFVKAYVKQLRRMHADDLHVVAADERERAAKIADAFAQKEREDVEIAGSSICYYGELIAANIRRDDKEERAWTKRDCLACRACLKIRRRDAVEHTKRNFSEKEP